MRRVLIEDLNYLPNEVDLIEPQIAAVVIERGLTRPASGMPASWRKTNIAKAVQRKKGMNLFKSVKLVMDRLFGNTFKSIGFFIIIG